MTSDKQAQGCQIRGCTVLVPTTGDSQGNKMPLCRSHEDILKVVVWVMVNIKIKPAEKPRN